jgi:hypothetical protein
VTDLAARVLERIADSYALLVKERYPLGNFIVLSLCRLINADKPG